MQVLPSVSLLTRGTLEWYAVVSVFVGRADV
jgi:hypothetical protein